MLAVVNTPNEAQTVKINEIADPQPAPNEALMAVDSFSVNRGELSLFKSRPAGWRPGQDIAGTVIQAAADGSGPKEGTRVVGLLDWYGWAQKAAVPTHHLAALPDGVSFSEAAALPIAGLTALRTLRMGGSLLGKKVLITGASGGVGHLAVQMAHHAGANVTGVAGHPESVEFVKGLGANAVIGSLDEVKGQFFDLITDATGGEVLAQAIKLVADEGKLIVYGNSSAEPTTFNVWDLFPHHAASIQVFVSYKSSSPEGFGQDLAVLAGLVAAGKLRPRIGLEIDWNNLNDGLQALRDRKIKGKLIGKVK